MSVQPTAHQDDVHNEIRLFRGTSPPELKLAAAHPALRVVYLRFHTDPHPVEGGPSQQICRAIADALCAHYAMTFVDDGSRGVPDSKRWEFHDGYASQKQARWFGKNYVLTWTRRADIGARALDQYWASEAQLVLLSEGDTPVDFDLFRFDVDAVGRVAALADSPMFVGALLPGVDGNFAALYFRSDAAIDRFIDTDLAAASTKHRIAISIADDIRSFVS
jgi:hypothetical protein